MISSLTVVELIDELAKWKGHYQSTSGFRGSSDEPATLPEKEVFSTGVIPRQALKDKGLTEEEIEEFIEFLIDLDDFNLNETYILRLEDANPYEDMDFSEYNVQVYEEKGNIYMELSCRNVDTI